MRKSFAIALIVSLTVTITSTQVKTHPKTSPKEVVEEYIQLIHQGALLTPDGWNKGGRLWEQSSPTPDVSNIWVVSTKSALSEYRVESLSAEVHEWGVNDLGGIDSNLHYLTPRNSDWVIKVYHLVLKAGLGEVDKAATGTSVWRIKGKQSARWTALEPAIRYVAEMRDKSRDPVAKKNADDTLAILNRLRATDSAPPK